MPALTGLLGSDVGPDRHCTDISRSCCAGRNNPDYLLCRSAFVRRNFGGIRPRRVRKRWPNSGLSVVMKIADTYFRNWKGNELRAYDLVRQRIGSTFSKLSGIISIRFSDKSSSRSASLLLLN